MKPFLKICLLLLPFFAKAQQVTILDTSLNNKWITLNQWRYQKGDNTEWANPAFNDSSWKKFSKYNLNMPDGKHAIADRGEIVWFRTLIKVDSTFNKTLVLNISQFGASEIYLDGQLIHQLGKLSADINQVKYYNPPLQQIFELPLVKGKQQVLAVRYVNAQGKFPIYNTSNGYIRILASTLSNANATNAKKNIIYLNRQIENNYYITLGIAVLMFIIFLSFFLFFPSEKINGYFASAIFFLILFVIGLIWSFNYYSGYRFLLNFCYCTSIVISLLISLYCTYKIFNKQIDVFGKTIFFLALAAICSFFFYNYLVVTAIWAILSMVATLRIALQSWKSNRVGSLLFISSSLILMIFWSLNILSTNGLAGNIIGLVQIRIGEFIPFAFMLNPIVLSIYLGYSFGKRSQELRLNLERVQKLSKEKESILSSQNETLEKQVQERTASLNQSIAHLKATQSQLIQSEKMASLGELTAGIAHEIQNPLNFVNNFSEVNKELLAELNDEIDKGNYEEVKAISKDVITNEEKINHHGKRADAIVKGMLQHSRSSSGQKELTDINALCDEYLRLAYHGLRAKDNSFNASFETQFDVTIGMISIQPQEMGRVVLNLINNAFYAVGERKKNSVESYDPKVTVSTEKKNGNILISIKDNGTGIPQKVVDKIFQPFFTTKPTGQGTGLGLSLSYDVVKAHGGELTVETREGKGSVFSINLPV